jgi:hypothetical protein
VKKILGVILNLIFLWLIFLASQVKIPEPGALLILGLGLIYVSKLLERVDLKFFFRKVNISFHNDREDHLTINKL